jgi:hypothetical protein
MSDNHGWALPRQNAIIVARVPEADLSSTVAVVQIQQRVGQVVSGATMLAVIEAAGSIEDRDAYNPVWVMIVVLSVVTCCVGACVPHDFTKSSGGYTRVDVEEDSESGQLLGGKDMEGEEEEEEEEEEPGRLENRIYDWKAPPKRGLGAAAQEHAMLPTPVRPLQQSSGGVVVSPSHLQSPSGKRVQQKRRSGSRP